MPQENTRPSLNVTYFCTYLSVRRQAALLQFRYHITTIGLPSDAVLAQE